MEQEDPLRLTADHHSLLIPWSQDRFQRTDCPWTLEQFSGGYGGWSFAQHFLESKGSKPHKTLGVECHMPYATQHALSHGYSLVGNPEDLPDDFI